jgi:hypothetical protein
MSLLAAVHERPLWHEAVIRGVAQKLVAIWGTGDMPLVSHILQVDRSTKFELLINMKTAKTLGLVVPDKMLALADEVIGGAARDRDGRPNCARR